MSEKPRISTLGQRIPVETVLPEKGKSEYVHLSQELSCILYCYIACGMNHFFSLEFRSDSPGKLNLYTCAKRKDTCLSETFTAASVVVQLSDIKFYYLRMQNYNKVQISVNELCILWCIFLLPSLLSSL